MATSPIGSRGRGDPSPGTMLGVMMRAKSLATLIKRIAPGSRLLRTRQLKGGLGCRMDVLEIERADGSREKVSLRRFEGEHSFSITEHAEREFAVLGLVEAAGIPAPRPILLDANGDLFGVPAIVLSYLPGRPHFASRNVEAWTQGLAGALHMVHAITPSRFDLSGLTEFGRDGMRQRIEQWRETVQTDLLAAEVYLVLGENLDRVALYEPTLIHDDYWPGNTVWFRARIAGIIDWSSAKLGDRRADVAQCRADLVISHGTEVAELFRAEYERLVGSSLTNLWYFDLFRGLDALLQHEQWLEGYHDLGLRHLAAKDVEGRLREFLRRAVATRHRQGWADVATVSE